MPVVPQAPEEIAQQGFGNIQAPTDAQITAFGGYDRYTPNPNHAVQGLASDVIQVADQEKARADEVATTAAHTQLLNLKNSLLYDPQNGAYTKKGQDAFAVPDLYNQKFQQGADQIAASLHNDQQKAAFGKMVEAYSGEFNGELDRHVYQQAQQYNKDTFTNHLEAAQKDAVLNYQVPGKVEQSLQTQQQALDTYAKYNGIAPSSDEYKNMQADIASKTHEAVISRMIDNGQDQAAKNYFDNVKDSLNTQTLVHTEKLVDEGSLRGQSQRIVDSMFDRNLTPQQAQDEMRDLTDTNPKLRDEVNARYRSQVAEQKALQADQIQKQFQSMAQTVEQTKSTDTLPRDQWLSLTLSDREALEKRADQLRRGIQPETDWRLYTDLKMLSSNPDTRSLFLKEDPYQWRTKLADPQYIEMVNIHDSLKKGDGKADALLNGFQTNQEIVSDTLKTLGVDPNAKAGSTQAEQVNRFRQMVDQQIINQQQVTGRKASTKEVQEIVDRLSQKVVTNRGWIWDSKAPLYQVNPGQMIEVNSSDIPRSERIKIEDALRRNNIPVTDKSMTDLYQRKLQGTINGK